MLCLSGFELYSHWVPLTKGMLNNISTKDLLHTCRDSFYQGSTVLNKVITLFETFSLETFIKKLPE